MFDNAKEKQANFMAGELLIPEVSARKAAFANWTNDEGAYTYGVSVQFAQMQMKGVQVFAQRTTQKYGRR